MEVDKDANKRRNILEIVSDLARYEDAPPASRVTPLKPRSAVVEPPSAPMLRADGPHAALAQMLAEAQARAAGQRAAAEKLLQEAHDLECRLADEAARAHAANEQALARELAEHLEEARAAEREAIERELSCSQSVETLTANNKQVQARHAELERTHRAASEQLADARRRFDEAEAACLETERRCREALVAEEAARAEARAAAETLTTRRRARQEIEQRLREIEERAGGTPIAVPSLETVDQLRALEARSVEQRRAADAELRIAERRAADAQRNLTG